MFGTAYKLCKDLGIKNGAMKLDVIDTPDGPVVLEATTRLSGGFDCQYLVPAATGMDVVKAAILNAIGRGVLNEAIAMALTKTKDKVAITESLWLGVGKKITKIDDSEALKLEGVELIYWRYKVGDVVEDYVDSSKRVCFIMTSGNTYEQAKAIMIIAMANTVVEVE
jgi:biotin carboxylase